MSACIQCSRKKVNAYRVVHKEALIATDKARREASPEARLYRSAKHASGRRGIIFELQVGDIKIPTHCPYLGVALTNIIGEGFQDYNPSIDRIDNTKPYTKENVEVISVLANRMKSTATISELQSFALGVLKKYAPN